MGDGLYAHVLRVRGLHLILLERLHLDEMPPWGTSTLMVAGNVLGHFLTQDPVELTSVRTCERYVNVPWGAW